MDLNDLEKLHNEAKVRGIKLWVGHGSKDQYFVKKVLANLGLDIKKILVVKSMDHYSFVNVSLDAVESFLGANGKKFNGRPIKIERAGTSASRLPKSPAQMRPSKTAEPIKRNPRAKEDNAKPQFNELQKDYIYSCAMNVFEDTFPVGTHKDLFVGNDSWTDHTVHLIRTVLLSDARNLIAQGNSKEESMKLYWVFVADLVRLAGDSKPASTETAPKSSEGPQLTIVSTSKAS